jgi:transposase-like protein
MNKMKNEITKNTIEKIYTSGKGEDCPKCSSEGGYYDASIGGYICNYCGHQF